MRPLGWALAQCRRLGRLGIPRGATMLDSVFPLRIDASEDLEAFVRHGSELCSPRYPCDTFPIELCHLLLFRRSTSGMKSSSSPCLGTPTGFALTTVVILLCRGELLVKTELCEA
jgi:hypothetical protein